MRCDPLLHGIYLRHFLFVGLQLFKGQKIKNPKAKQIERTVPKNFLNNSRTRFNKTRVFEANLTRKFAQKFSKIFVAKVLWGAFSVPEMWQVGVVAGIFQTDRKPTKGSQAQSSDGLASSLIGCTPKGSYNTRDSKKGSEERGSRSRVLRRALAMGLMAVIRNARLFIILFGVAILLGGFGVAILLEAL